MTKQQRYKQLLERHEKLFQLEFDLEIRATTLIRIYESGPRKLKPYRDVKQVLTDFRNASVALICIKHDLDQLKADILHTQRKKAK